MRKLRDSFKYAFNGFKETLIHERNFKIMIIVAALVVAAMLYFPTSRTEKAVLMTAIFTVLTLELVNVVIERLLDFLQPKYNEQVRLIKDLMAAIVLVASFGAVIIGLLVFWPHFFNLL